MRESKVCRTPFKTFFLAVAITFLTAAQALSHDVPAHLDPELLTGWRTWLHLTIQWTHLVAFALWLGLTAGTLLLGMRPPLDHLLYSSWILFLVLLATGTYNMEWSAGISETPSPLLLPLLERIPYGVTYTVALAVKLALYVLILLFTLVITALHLRHRVDETRLRRIFLICGLSLGMMITLMTAVVLFYHEVADLWPTRLHSLGGVMGPEGPRGQNPVSPGIPSPNDFLLLASREAWINIGLRWVHLLGFGLWLGGIGVALVFGRVSPRRFLMYSWIVLITQGLSGIASMDRWTPFYLPPYVWNLSNLSQVRFGRSYTLFMAIKHALVVAVISLMVFATIRYRRVSSTGETNQFSLRPFVVLNLLLGLAIGYIVIIILLLHEGVDHAL